MDLASAYNRATAALRAGHFSEAWPLYEARIPLLKLPEPITKAPEWRGEDVAGKRVAVCAEQGFGDQLMFGRYLPELRARGAEIVVQCHPAYLARTFEAAGYWTRPLYLDRPIEAVDCWTRFGSLPYRLALDSLPPAAYVPVPIGSGGGVGVLANGNPEHWNDAHRSLPADQAARLLDLGRDLSPEATGAIDFLQTAELIADLDVIITVDTSLAHLAGAIGKPCWVLLPADGMDWRWANGVSSPWYPMHRLWRQARPNGWPNVLDQIRAAVALGGP